MSSCRTISAFSFKIPNRAGELARLMNRFREADIEMLAMHVFEDEVDASIISCLAQSEGQFRDFLRSTDIVHELNKAFMLVMPDEPGALVTTLDTISTAQINLRGVSAISTGIDFGCILWPEPKDEQLLAELLAVTLLAEVKHVRHQKLPLLPA